MSSGTADVVAEPGGAGGPRRPDWLQPPHNRRAFRKTRTYFRSDRVRAAGGSPLAHAEVSLEIDPALADYLRRSYTDGFMVLHRGEVVTEWYADGVRPDDRHIIFSCTKSVVALVAEALIAEGHLDENATVVSYLPETAQGGFADATVRQVLDMTADIAFREDYDGTDIRAFRVASGQIEETDSPGIHAYTAGLPAAGPHGRATRYASPTADLVGWLCEEVTGRSTADLVSSYVWEPMGAEWEGDLLLDRFGAARVSGGLCAGLGDMVRIGQLLLADDLPTPLAAAVEAVKRPGDLQAWAAGSLGQFIPGAAYRSFWYQIPPGPDVYLAAGIYGQRIYVDVPRQVVIAQQASLPDSFDAATWAETLPLFARIADRVAAR